MNRTEFKQISFVCCVCGVAYDWLSARANGLECARCGQPLIRDTPETLETDLSRLTPPRRRGPRKKGVFENE